MSASAPQIRILREPALCVLSMLPVPWVVVGRADLTAEEARQLVEAVHRTDAAALRGFDATDDAVVVELAAQKSEYEGVKHGSDCAEGGVPAASQPCCVVSAPRSACGIRQAIDLRWRAHALRTLRRLCP